MSILDNIFDQYLSLLIDILKESYDQKFIQDISNFIECKFKSLIISEATKNITPNDPNQKMHIVTPYFIIAFYRAFKNKLGNELSLDLIKNLMMRTFREFVGPIAEMQKNGLKNVNDKWEKFREQTVFGTKNTNSSFDPVFIKNNDNNLEFHLNRCVFYEILNAHGEPDLAPILCDYDSIFSEAVQEWITFRRPKTIADGFPSCHFVYFPNDE